MELTEFEELLKNRINKINETLAVKGSEYSSKIDRLHNFKSAGRMKGETPQEALWGMLMKHLVSVEDLIKDRLENNRHNVDEKIGDVINYLILLEALFEDLR